MICDGAERKRSMIRQQRTAPPRYCLLKTSDEADDTVRCQRRYASEEEGAASVQQQLCAEVIWCHRKRQTKRTARGRRDR